MKNLKLKKSLGIAILIILISTKSQCVKAQTWHTTGDVINGSEYLGANSTSTIPFDIKTIPSLNINFWTNNTQRMTILSGGNVGIGSTSPSRLLDVLGAANSPQFRISYDASNYTDFKARSNGNLIINPLS
ncbi:MAG: hypothetical protein IPO83_03370 [Chitinophagaceae bacterium]|nr:hypothetical protein [Chitinophagaceae bacterium]